MNKKEKKYSESTIGALIEKHNDELASIKEYLKDVPRIKNKTVKIEEKLENIKMNIELIKISLKGKARIEEVQKIETRVKILEKQVL
jgi:hypothetical protein